MPSYSSADTDVRLSEFEISPAYIATTATICFRANAAMRVYRATILEDKPFRGGQYYGWALRNRLCVRMPVIVPADTYRRCRLRVSRECGALRVNAGDDNWYLIVFPNTYN